VASKFDSAYMFQARHCGTRRINERLGKKLGGFACVQVSDGVLLKGVKSGYTVKGNYGW
jgi:hypothetical protein